VAVDYAGLESVDRYSFLKKMAHAGSVIHLRIKPGGDLLLNEFQLDSIRFFLNADPMAVNLLYETIFCNLVNLLILPEGKETPIVLPLDSITPVGFQEGEEIIPGGVNSHPAYGLIQEFFCFPEKYHFIDLKNIAYGDSQRVFDLLLILDNSPQLPITANTFVPNCAPIVNLFASNSGVIELNQKKQEYHLVADPDAKNSLEVHSVLKVSSSATGEEEEKTVEPFYALSHRQTGGDNDCYWFLNRKESWLKGVRGTETFLSFQDQTYTPVKPDGKLVYVKTLCTDRDRASNLPAGALLELEEKGAIQRTVCLKQPTSPHH
jgi:type VI secretion system protein ImpG